MYIHTHVFFVKKKVNKPSNLTIVGSFIPDMAFTKIIGWDDLHKKENIEKFQKFIKHTNPKLKDLGEGIVDHFIVDEVTHKHYKDGTGYAYKTITPKLIKLVAQAFQIENDKVARTIAHNAIELAVDSFVVKNNPKILKDVKNAVNMVDKDAIANLISSFFNLNNKKTRSALEQYFSFMTRYDTRNINDCIKLCGDMNIFLFNKTVNKDKTRQSILYSRDLVKNSYQEFLKSLTKLKTKN